MRYSYYVSRSNSQLFYRVSPKTPFEFITTDKNVNDSAYYNWRNSVDYELTSYKNRSSLDYELKRITKKELMLELM